jgi:photosystem II stability/assembly factor-like uncharacterized protein
MRARRFLSTLGESRGLARAERGPAPGDDWTVEPVLAGRDARCIAADPLDPRVVYAAVDGEGVLRSEDGGRSWRLAGGPEGPRRDVRSLAVSPHEPGVVYAGTRPASVFVSRAGGVGWTELEGFRRIRGRWLWRSPAELPDTRAYVLGLSVSPEDPDRIVAGIEFGALVYSDDGGRRWSTHRKGALRDCHSLTFHASDGSWVYQAGGGGAACSQDGGVTWQSPKDGLDRRYGWACAADPARPEVWYASASPMPSLLRGELQPPAHVDGRASAAIYRWNGRAAWQKLDGGLPDPLDHMAYALLTDPAAPGHLYAGLANGDIWHSADHGDSWRRLPLSLGGIHRSLLMWP